MLFANDTHRLFDDLTLREVHTSAGRIALPIQYHDASMFSAMWRVDAKRAAAVVPEPLEPWLLFGKAIAMLCVFDYRKTTIGPYGELGLGVLARPRGTSPSWARAAIDMRDERDAALYVTDLPVTTKNARAAGIELWGYPKYVADMQLEFAARRSRVVLGNELEVTLHHGGGGLPTPGLPLCTWSTSLQNELVRTVVDTDFTARWGGSVDVKILDGGPTADTMRALGIDRAKAAFAFRAEPMRSRLGLGVDRGPASPRVGKNDHV